MAGAEPSRCARVGVDTLPTPADIADIIVMSPGQTTLLEIGCTPMRSP